MSKTKIDFKLRTPKTEVDRMFKAAVGSLDDQIVTILDYVGVNATNDARIAGTYTDRTGNLRSSTGYRVIRKGEVVGGGGFAPVSGTRVDTSGNSESYSGDYGSSVGAELADKIAGELADAAPFVLILVAGMEYASYVEARGYNVLAHSEILAEDLVTQLLTKLGK